jgi:YbbR domain-containing protein
MDIKKLIVNNSGLKITALLLAILVWALISGKERTFLDKSLEIEVENLNVSKMIDVRNRPETIRLKIKGTSKEMGKITPDDFKLRIDMKDINESTRFSVFTEDYLEYPKDIHIESIHPKMIEVTAREFFYKEVPVRILYTGRLAKGISIVERKIVPEKVRIFGYRAQLLNINTVFGAEKIDLSKIHSSTSLKIPLNKGKEILRFDDFENVTVNISVENLNAKRKKK